MRLVAMSERYSTRGLVIVRFLVDTLSGIGTLIQPSNDQMRRDGRLKVWRILMGGRRRPALFPIGTGNF